MTPLHVLSAPAPRDTLLHALPPPAPRGAPLPALSPRAARSLYSGLILAFILLALLLQASFFVGLASGRVAGPDALGAPRAASAP